MEEFKAILKRIKKNKAPAPDGLTSEITKIAVEINKEKMLNIFNKASSPINGR